MSMDLKILKDREDHARVKGAEVKDLHKKAHALLGKANSSATWYDTEDAFTDLREATEELIRRIRIARAARLVEEMDVTDAAEARTKAERQGAQR